MSTTLATLQGEDATEWGRVPPFPPWQGGSNRARGQTKWPNYPPPVAGVGGTDRTPPLGNRGGGKPSPSYPPPAHGPQSG